MSDALTGPLTRLIGISKEFKATAPQISNDFCSQLYQLNNFTACVPLIGIFSAGKSSLLNLWLGQNILPVDQAPTTALATELHYGEQQSLVITPPMVPSENCTARRKMLAMSIMSQHKKIGSPV